MSDQNEIAFDELDDGTGDLVLYVRRDMCDAVREWTKTHSDYGITLVYADELDGEEETR